MASQWNNFYKSFFQKKDLLKNYEPDSRHERIGAEWTLHMPSGVAVSMAGEALQSACNARLAGYAGEEEINGSMMVQPKLSEMRAWI